jgi:hypothetical protein
VNLAAAELVAVTQDAIRENWWVAAACHSPEHWLQATAGLDAPRARRVVRIARGLVDWPHLGERFGRGLVTEAAVDIVVSECWHAYDAELAGAVGHWSIAQLHRMKRLFAPPPVEDADDGGEPVASAVRDTFSCGWDDDGRYRGRFDLGPASGSVLAAAVEAARRRLHRERGDDPEGGDDLAHPPAAAEVLVRLAHGALRGLDPATADGRGDRPSDRYLAIVHVDVDDLGTARTHLGPLLPRPTVEELLCDCDLQALLSEGGRPVAWGRRRRLADPLLRRLIEDRDRGCRVCGAPGFLHIHHLRHWTRGGPTDPENLVAVCTRCHTATHRGTLRLEGTATALRILDRHGRPVARPSPIEPDRPPPTEPYAPIRGTIHYSHLPHAQPPRDPSFGDEFWSFN